MHEPDDGAAGSGDDWEFTLSPSISSLSSFVPEDFSLPLPQHLQHRPSPEPRSQQPIRRQSQGDEHEHDHDYDHAQRNQQRSLNENHDHDRHHTNPSGHDKTRQKQRTPPLQTRRILPTRASTTTTAAAAAAAAASTTAQISIPIPHLHTPPPTSPRRKPGGILLRSSTFNPSSSSSLSTSSSSFLARPPPRSSAASPTTHLTGSTTHTGRGTGVGIGLGAGLPASPLHLPPPPHSATMAGSPVAGAGGMRFGLGRRLGGVGGDGDDGRPGRGFGQGRERGGEGDGSPPSRGQGVGWRTDGGGGGANQGGEGGEADECDDDQVHHEGHDSESGDDASHHDGNTDIDGLEVNGWGGGYEEGEGGVNEQETEREEEEENGLHGSHDDEARVQEQKNSGAKGGGHGYEPSLQQQEDSGATSRRHEHEVHIQGGEDAELDSYNYVYGIKKAQMIGPETPLYEHYGGKEEDDGDGEAHKGWNIHGYVGHEPEDEGDTLPAGRVQLMERLCDLVQRLSSARVGGDMEDDVIDVLNAKVDEMEDLLMLAEEAGEVEATAQLEADLLPGEQARALAEEDHVEEQAERQDEEQEEVQGEDDAERQGEEQAEEAASAEPEATPGSASQKNGHERPAGNGQGDEQEEQVGSGFEEDSRPASERPPAMPSSVPLLQVGDQVIRDLASPLPWLTSGFKYAELSISPTESHLELAAATNEALEAAKKAAQAQAEMAERVAVQAEKLNLELAAVVKKLLARKEESDHLHALLVDRAEAAAARILDLEREVCDLEDDLLANESELRHLRLKIRAVETVCHELVPADRADPVLLQSIENWKADWVLVRDRMLERKRDRRERRLRLRRAGCPLDSLEEREAGAAGREGGESTLTSLGALSMSVSLLGLRSTPRKAY